MGSCLYSLIDGNFCRVLLIELYIVMIRITYEASNLHHVNMELLSRAYLTVSGVR
jgi:hypothetical protein